MSEQENTPMKLKLPESELKNVTTETMNKVTHLQDKDIEAMLPPDVEQVIDEPIAGGKKRGRKSKEEKQAEEKAEMQQKLENATEQIEALKAVVEQGLTFLAKRMPNPIPASELEINSITKSFDIVARKHLGKFIDYAPEIALAGSLAFFFLPRAFAIEEPEKKTHAIAA